MSSTVEFFQQAREACREAQPRFKSLLEHQGLTGEERARLHHLAAFLAHEAKRYERFAAYLDAWSKEQVLEPSHYREEERQAISFMAMIAKREAELAQEGLSEAKRRALEEDLSYYKSQVLECLRLLFEVKRLPFFLI